MTATFSVFVWAAVVAAPEPKELLHNMVKSRRAFATADLTWVNSTTKSPPRYFRSRYDGTNWTFANIPDPDGIVDHSQLGEPFACADSSFFYTDERLWHTVNDGGLVEIFDDNSRERSAKGPFGQVVVDARIFGLTPENTARTLENVMEPLVQGGDMTTKDEGGGIVTLTVPSSNGTIITWWIDTNRNYNPTRIERRWKDGTLVSETRIELAYYDNHVWFPKKIEQTKSRMRKGMDPSTVEFISAEFDRPEHPRVLGPEHVGVVRFSPLIRQSGKATVPCCWDGKDVFPVSEMYRRMEAGQIKDADLVDLHARNSRRLLAGEKRWPAWYADPNYGVTKRSEIDEWEKYVRRFCMIRKCDDRQKASAKGILDDCRKSAMPHVAKAMTEKDAKKQEAMLAPVADIFAKSLVPRLDALLATAQSQPATPQVLKLPPVAGNTSGR